MTNSIAASAGKTASRPVLDTEPDDTAGLPCFNPATGEQFAQVRMSTPAQVRQAVADMRATAPAWRLTPLPQRIRHVRALQSALLDAREEITETINRDTGKSRQDALVELFVTADGIHVNCLRAPRWLRRERVASGLHVFKRCYVEPRPRGVVAIIAPWNYPLALTVAPLAAALLAGNTVILKPSEVTAASGELVERLIARVPELAQCVRVLHGDGRVGEALVAAAPDHIFLTGSTATGRRVMRAAAENLVPITAELGGKDAMLVLEDADLDAAAEWGAWGSFFNAGQTCMAVERVYVVAAVYDAFVDKAIAAANKQTMGYSLERSGSFHLGPLAYARQLQTVQDHVQEAVDQGARVLTGGRCRDMFYEPTVMVDVTHDMRLMREETFGPIMPIMKVRDQAEAIRLANDSDYGLSASVWTRDLRRAQQVARQLETGSVLVNDAIAHFGVPSVPFGGVKHSGYGRTHGKDGLLQFTQPHAFVEGSPPNALDIATLLRRPGHYRLGSILLHLAFGRGLRQRLQPFTETATPAVGRQRSRLFVALASAAAALRAFVLGLTHPGRPRG